MKVIRIEELQGTEREVHCPHGGFISYRALLAKDNMGFSLHKTVIPAGAAEHWHYTRHLEACYCIAGYGVLTNLATKEQFVIVPDTIYALDLHDDHLFQAHEKTVLISIFTPPVTGGEVHQRDGSYAAAK